MKVADFIRLTRPSNLIIIALTMVLMRWFVLKPAVEINGFSLQLSNFHFFLLVLSTIFIAAAGNIINDYFDQRVDRINKPERVIVGATVKRRVAMVIHQVLNFLGIGMALWVSYSVGLLNFVLIHFIAVGLLWFYSTNFKRQLLVGNLIIAFLTAIVPLQVGIYEIPLLIRRYGEEVAAYFQENMPELDPQNYFLYMFYFILGFAVFAFILNFIREIQKDMADIEGDREIDCKTFPIVFGLTASKNLVMGLVVLAMAGIFVVQQLFLDHWKVLVYFSLAIIVPLGISGWMTWMAKNRKGFVRAAGIMKISMLGGILYSIVHYYIYYTSP